MVFSFSFFLTQEKIFNFIFNNKFNIIFFSQKLVSFLQKARESSLLDWDRIKGLLGVS